MGSSRTPEDPERRVDLDHEIGRDPVPLRQVAVVLLDAALGVLPVPAEVPLHDGAVRTGDRIGPADDADDQIALLHRRPGRRLEHAADATRDPSTSRSRPGGAQP